jgi:hypothetical protein
MKLFGYTLPELSAAIIAAIYFVFAIVMLFIIPPAGFENAVLAVVPAFFAVIQVFGATEHTPGDLSKTLEQLKMTALTATSFYIAVPANVGNAITMLITGAVAAAGIYWARKGKVSSNAAIHEGSLPR